MPLSQLIQRLIHMLEVGAVDPPPGCAIEGGLGAVVAPDHAAVAAVAIDQRGG